LLPYQPGYPANAGYVLANIAIANIQNLSMSMTFFMSNVPIVRIQRPETITVDRQVQLEVPEKYK
jgi:hypothetical protein